MWTVFAKYKIQSLSYVQLYLITIIFYLTNDNCKQKIFVFQNLKNVFRRAHPSVRTTHTKFQNH